ncbi:30S ribosomal protein S8 [Candidatus Hydrogenedentota bacterium]
MGMTDPIADMLTRIRNASAMRHSRVDVPASKVKAEIAAVLEREGYIESSRKVESQGHGTLRLYLKYDSNGDPVISKLTRVSKPGLRVYRGVCEVPRALGGLGIVVMSTNAGVMTGNEAREAKVGGEVLCEIW